MVQRRALDVAFFQRRIKHAGGITQRGRGDQRVAYRRVELMCHTGHELTQGRQLLRVHQLFLRLLKIDQCGTQLRRALLYACLQLLVERLDFHFGTQPLGLVHQNRQHTRLVVVFNGFRRNDHVHPAAIARNADNRVVHRAAIARKLIEPLAALLDLCPNAQLQRGVAQHFFFGPAKLALPGRIDGHVAPIGFAGHGNGQRAGLADHMKAALRTLQRLFTGHQCRNYQLQLLVQCARLADVVPMRLQDEMHAHQGG